MTNKNNNSAVSRLKQDYLRLKRDPLPYILAEPLPSNILEWHYVVNGPEDSPYEGGFYHGKLIFPREFPFKPPAIYMITPNGRFKANKRLCLSISDFHPDTWNPAWSVSTILTGLLSFMLERSPTLGSIESTDLDKRQFAYNSLEFNIKNKEFCDLFPETVDKIQSTLQQRRICLANRNAGGDSAGDSNGTAGDHVANSRSVGDAGTFHNYIMDLIVVVGFVVFVFTVKYVMLNSSNEKD